MSQPATREGILQGLLALAGLCLVLVVVAATVAMCFLAQENRRLRRFQLPPTHALVCPQTCPKASDQ